MDFWTSTASNLIAGVAAFLVSSALTWLVAGRKARSASSPQLAALHTGPRNDVRAEASEFGRAVVNYTDNSYNSSQSTHHHYAPSQPVHSHAHRPAANSPSPAVGQTSDDIANGAGLLLVYLGVAAIVITAFALWFELALIALAVLWGIVLGIFSILIVIAARVGKVRTSAFVVVAIEVAIASAAVVVAFVGVRLTTRAGVSLEVFRSAVARQAEQEKSSPLSVVIGGLLHGDVAVLFVFSLFVSFVLVALVLAGAAISAFAVGTHFASSKPFTLSNGRVWGGLIWICLCGGAVILFATGAGYDLLQSWSAENNKAIDELLSR